MTARARRGAAVVIGLGLAPTRVVACVRAGDGAIQWHEADLPTAFDAWSRALQDALGAWCAPLATGAVQVRAALLAPLAEVRSATLPPVSDADARRLLMRNAARHFLHATEPMRCGTSPALAASEIASDAAAPSTRRLVAGAAARHVRAIEAAVQAAGAQLMWIVPAATLWPTLPVTGGRAVSVLLEGRDGQIDVWSVRNGALHDVRRRRPEEVSEVLTGGEPVLLLGDAHERLGARRASLQVVTVDERLTAAADGADTARLAAVRCAMESRTEAHAMPLALIDESAPVARARASDARSWRAAVAAAVLLGVGLLGDRLWIERQLASVRAERAALADTLTARGLRAVPGDTGTLVRVVRDSLAAQPVWSDVLDEIAARLPAGTSVRTLAARGDSLVLEGLADDAAAAFAALDASSRLDGVAVVGPVRRERDATGRVTERFTLRAGVRTP